LGETVLLRRLREPDKTWKEAVDKDMDVNPSDAMDHSIWRRMI